MTEENTYKFRFIPEHSHWKCYMFGNRPEPPGMVYTPIKGREPNKFARWMMCVCFDCLWVNEGERND